MESIPYSEIQIEEVVWRLHVGRSWCHKPTFTKRESLQESNSVHEFIVSQEGLHYERTIHVREAVVVYVTTI